MLENLKGERRLEKFTQAKEVCVLEWQQFDLTELYIDTKQE